MNDPNLDTPIATAANHVQEQHDNGVTGSSVGEEEEEEIFLLPARWWWASTAFPLMAGTFGPMANAFSICALVENWRVKIPKGGTEEHGMDIPDPKWLVAVNAISLVFALIANLTLLLNMARRLSFRAAQPITIWGFWIASVTLIALIAVASDRKKFHQPGVEDQVLTQAYYYATFAAGLYQIISYLMMLTAYGALKGNYSKEFKLTIPQRTLMLQTICWLVYLLLGALVYSKIEGWKFLDAVYWADFTLLTIGIGDPFTPKTHLGRALLFPFAIGGIVYLGLVVGSIRSLMLDRTKKKLGARMAEKVRRRVIKRVEAAEHGSKPINKIRGLDKKTSKRLALDPHGYGEGEKKRREAEFNAMRAIQEMASKERQWVSLIISSLLWLFLWIVGAVVFWKTEKKQGWSYFESVYFSYTTLLTIGYGDFQPISNSGKPFFVFWSLLAVPTLTILISHMGNTVIQLIKDVTIWLGEVTVLPSESVSIRQSLKFGVIKLTGGKIDVQGIKDSDDDVEEVPTGLIRLPRQRKHAPNHSKEDVEHAQILASDFEQAEKLDEDEARRQGNRLAEDIHHYRHMLVKEIRNLYADLMTAEPKKYTYDEWSYFLELLGEDEGDSKYHRKAPLNAPTHDLRKRTDESTAVSKEEQETEKDDDAGQMDAAPDNQENNSTEHKIQQWSWMGSRSPLMGEKEEAEWLLEKLLAKLEDELQRETKLAEQLRTEKEEEQDTPRWPLRRAEDREKAVELPSGGGGGDEGDDGSGGILETLQGRAGKEEADSSPASREDKKGR